jgi:DNA-binding CsgD family transcriptional regulator
MMDMVVQGMHATGGLTAKQMESLRWWLDTAVAAADEFGS